MNPFRREGLGWTAAVLSLVGAVIVVANLLDADFWLLSVFSAIPMVFGLVVLAVGAALLLAGIFSGREADNT